MDKRMVSFNSVIFRYYLCFMIFLGALALSFCPVNAEESPGEASPGEASSLFQQANSCYRLGDYTQAVALYGNLADAGYEGGQLFYNPGNAYFKSGRKGWAVLYYYKALRFMPGDADLQGNLKLALTGLPEARPGFIENSYRKVVYLAPLNRFTVISSVSFFLFMIVLSLGILFSNSNGSNPFKQPTRRWRGLLLITGIFFLLSLSVTIASVVERSSKQAVIVKSSVSAGFEPGPSSSVCFRLAEGSRINILKQQAEWSLVRQKGGKRGWVPRDSYQNI